MSKFLNDPADVAAETLTGYLRAHQRQLTQVPGRNGFVRSHIPDGKTVLVVGGGSGHEPVWLEYVGDGFADAVCQGDLFAAPPPGAIVDTARAAHRGGGVVFMYGNYAGDRLNFDIAAERLVEEGIPVRTVRVTDDVASASFEHTEQRRGIAGGVFACKVAGTAAARGDDIDTVSRIGQHAVDATRSIGVASAAGVVPGTEQPTFTLAPGRMEIGMGMHGEKGVWPSELLTAADTTRKMLELLLADRPLLCRNVAVLLNGLGATTRGELWIIAGHLLDALASADLTVEEVTVAEAATSQEMHGFSISLFELTTELSEFYFTPSSSSFWPGSARL